MGEENIVEEMATETTVADMIQEETQIVETEESSNQSSGCGKAIAIKGVAAAGIAVGAGYGLYRLGKLIVGKVKREMLKKQVQKEIDEFDDFDVDEEDAVIEETTETTEVVEQKVEFPDHKKKKH